MLQNHIHIVMKHSQKHPQKKISAIFDSGYLKMHFLILFSSVRLLYKHTLVQWYLSYVPMNALILYSYRNFRPNSTLMHGDSVGASNFTKYYMKLYVKEWCVAYYVTSIYINTLICRKPQTKNACNFFPMSWKESWNFVFKRIIW